MFYFAMIFILAITLILLENANGGSCPVIYSRLSSEHSFCRPRNSACTIFSKGIQSKDEIKEILDIHNKYRSQVAMGQEERAGHLPKASNMMQMVWDDEIAAVAQKWAEQCRYEHDCRACRSVLSYATGQNLAYKEWTCNVKDCEEQDKAHKRNWSDVIKLFYEEVTNFDKSIVPSVYFANNKIYGHFTQLIWATSWRVGCGYVSYKNGDSYRQFYVCDYGPGGNIVTKPVYKTGEPCTDCPANSCCGDSCKGSPFYPGLCRMLDNNGAPVYPVDKNGLLFYCDFRKESTEDCSLSSIGGNKWKTFQTHSGTFMGIVLNGGEKSTLNFKKSVTPNHSGFCMVITYRKGPNKAKDKSANKLTVDFTAEGLLPVTITLAQSLPEYTEYSLDLKWNSKTSFAMTFSVPPGSPPQYLNIKSIEIRDGKCQKRNSG